MKRVKHQRCDRRPSSSLYDLFASVAWYLQIFFVTSDQTNKKQKIWYYAENQASSHPLGPEVGVLGLLLAGVRPVHGIVLLQLHGLHLLLDRVHGEAAKKKEKNRAEYFNSRRCPNLGKVVCV